MIECSHRVNRLSAREQINASALQKEVSKSIKDKELAISNSRKISIVTYKTIIGSVKEFSKEKIVADKHEII